LFDKNTFIFRYTFSSFTTSRTYLYIYIYIIFYIHLPTRVLSRFFFLHHPTSRYTIYVTSASRYGVLSQRRLTATTTYYILMYVLYTSTRAVPIVNVANGVYSHLPSHPFPRTLVFQWCSQLVFIYLYIIIYRRFLLYCVSNNVRLIKHSPAMKLSIINIHNQIYYLPFAYTYVCAIPTNR